MPESVRLLKSKRFLPFFLTQLLGAFNDNLYKNGLTIFIVFQAFLLYTFDPPDE
mgnify:CR=1 FL=1